MRYLLDTCVISDFIKGETGTKVRLKQTLPVLSAVTILPFSTVEAEQAAQIRAFLKSQGQPIGAYDVLIAATALQHNLLMITANPREFDRVPGLQTENWRQP
jgi:tRNA(fMet)-specific endonuclease VapC